MNKTVKYAITIVLTALAVTGFILFEIIHIKMVEDTLTNLLLGRVLYYLFIVALMLWLSYILNNSSFLYIKNIKPKQLLWCLPCLLVALVNFPYTALISNSLTITRFDLMGLYIGYVVLIAILEEFVFRGVLLFLLLDVFRRQRLKYFLSALISSLIFSLFHLTNVFAGMDIASVLLQMVYTFLIGGMLSVTALKLKNVWPCIVIHAVFDFGGLITNIAIGDPWDLTFWILTITCGILCAGHIIVTLINLERKYVS